MCINPQYIILKPSLHGEIVGSTEKINIVECWLNIIALFASYFDNPLPQGLEIGGLYVHNEQTKLFVYEGHLYLDN